MPANDDTSLPELDIYLSLCVFGPSYADGVPENGQIETFRKALTDDRFRKMFNHWHELRKELGPFSHSDIRPQDIPRLLQHYFLLEQDAESEQISPRIAGTSFVELLGDEPTNIPFDKLAPPGHVEFWRQIINRVLDDECPALLRWPLDFMGKDYRDVICLTLPLKDKDGSRYMNGIALPARSARLEEEGALETA